jgi:diguanylate cyclase (GGDEF)-like protein
VKILRVHLVEIVAALLFVVLVVIFCQGGRGMDRDVQKISFNEDWTIVVGEEAQDYSMLPKSIDRSGEVQKIILTKQLSEDVDSKNSIGFYTIHQNVEVFVDGEKIYECKVPEGARSKTPGNCWNFVQLLQEYAGKILEVHISNCYDFGQVKVPEFIQGVQSVMILSLIRSQMLAFVISFIVFAMGLMLVIGWFALGKNMRFHNAVPWLGLFAIHFAIWSGFETQVPMLMFGNPLLCNYIDILSLKLMPLPIIYFIRIVYSKNDNRMLGFLEAVSQIEFAVSLLGHIFGWFDLQRTLWITHVVGILIVAAAVGLGIQFIVQKGRKKIESGENIWKNTVCIGIVGVCIILDAINYYSGFHDDVAYFSRIGCLVYVVVLTKQFLEESIKLIQVGKEAEALRQEAELDGLTMLKNRRSFEQDLHQINKGEFRRYSVVMFDLNNLKLMNDQFGHGMGDYYIITGSEIIRDTFGEFGEIYRIGGDEFCLISDSISEEIYKTREKQMCDWLENLQGSQMKDFMQIASGFAKYNRGTDMNLLDTFGRADERMYQCKRKQKAARNNGGKV